MITFVGMPQECNCTPTDLILETIVRGEPIRIAYFSRRLEAIRNIFLGAAVPNIYPFNQWEFFEVGGFSSDPIFTPFQIGVGESFTFDIWTGVTTFPLTIITNLDCDEDGLPDQSLTTTNSTFFVECW